jgi:hypothetical protein
VFFLLLVLVVIVRFLTEFRERIQEIGVGARFARREQRAEKRNASLTLSVEKPVAHAPGGETPRYHSVWRIRKVRSVSGMWEEPQCADSGGLHNPGGRLDTLQDLD